LRRKAEKPDRLLPGLERFHLRLGVIEQAPQTDQLEQGPAAIRDAG
jgi:hypothetical protein